MHLCGKLPSLASIGPAECVGIWTLGSTETTGFTYCIGSPRLAKVIARLSLYSFKTSDDIGSDLLHAVVVHEYVDETAVGLPLG